MQTLLRAEASLTRRELVAAVQELEASRLALLRANTDGRSDRAAELRQVIIPAIERDIRRLDRRLAQLTSAPRIVAGPHN